jgi:hypothetical protein
MLNETVRETNRELHRRTYVRKSHFFTPRNKLNLIHKQLLKFFFGLRFFRNAFQFRKWKGRMKIVRKLFLGLLEFYTNWIGFSFTTKSNVNQFHAPCFYIRSCSRSRELPLITQNKNRPPKQLINCERNENVLSRDTSAGRHVVT